MLGFKILLLILKADFSPDVCFCCCHSPTSSNIHRRPRRPCLQPSALGCLWPAAPRAQQGGLACKFRWRGVDGSLNDSSKVMRKRPDFDGRIPPAAAVSPTAARGAAQPWRSAGCTCSSVLVRCAGEAADEEGVAGMTTVAVVAWAAMLALPAYPRRLGGRLGGRRPLSAGRSPGPAPEPRPGRGPTTHMHNKSDMSRLQSAVFQARRPAGLPRRGRDRGPQSEGACRGRRG